MKHDDFQHLLTLSRLVGSSKLLADQLEDIICYLNKLKNLGEIQSAWSLLQPVTTLRIDKARPETISREQMTPNLKMTRGYFTSPKVL